MYSAVGYTPLHTDATLQVRRARCMRAPACRLHGRS
jgi:hypothetical protein